MRIIEDHRCDAKTERQVAHRSRFKGAIGLTQSLQSLVVQTVWATAAKKMKMSGFNLFFKTNMKAFDQDGQLKDYGLLQISKGNLVPAGLTIEPTTDVAKSVTISWEDNTGLGGACSNDRLRLLVIKDGLKPVLLKTTFERSAGTGNFEIPFESGDEVHLYAFFENAKGDQFSVDTYQAVVLG